MDLQSDFQALFDEMPDLLPTNITFFEIAGYPHYENVCSNILKFFLNPKTILHGLDDLLLKSLLQTCNKFYSPYSDFDSIIVKREVVTETGKRIDLVVYTNKWAIGIENKIRHVLNNDLDEYSNYLNKYFNGRQILKIVLSIKTETETLSAGFLNITYKDLIKRIDDNIKTSALNSSNPYYIFFSQFIQTLKNMYMITSMDKEEIDFLRNNQDKIKQIVALEYKLEAYITHRANSIKNAITIGANYKKWVYDEYDVGFHYTFNNVHYKLECPITKEGIRIKLCVESNKIDFDELQKLDFFKKNNINNFKADEENSKLVLEDNIDFFTPDEVLIEKSKGYLAELKISETINV